jgi:hypothetical protein
MTLTAAADTRALPCPEPDSDLLWPSDDILVLRSRPVRVGTSRDCMSRFGDELWHLRPAHPDAHITTPLIRWERFPQSLRRQFKAFFFAALDQPYPVGPGGQRPGRQPSVGTMPYWAVDLSAFATWLDDHGVARLRDVGAGMLDSYRAHVLAMERSPARKADMFAVVRTLWLYRSLLPGDCRLPVCPWQGLTEYELVKARHRDGQENKTPRIAPGTMEALLSWALTMIEVAGPGIRGAWCLYRQLEDCAHESQREYAGLTRQDRLVRLIETRSRDGDELPGRPGGGINHGHVLRLIATPEHDRGGLTAGQKRLLAQSGIPVADDTYIGGITGKIDGRPWRERPITVQELPTLVRLLYAAAFIVICYLSGMRPGEVLNLPRGCRDTDEGTGELLIRGQRGKGYDRTPLPGDTRDRHRPWVVAVPVHAAIAVLEELFDGPLLFPASLAYAHKTRPGKFNARKSQAINADMGDFINWVNASFAIAGRAEAIPADPCGPIFGRRFRRTLACARSVSDQVAV